AVMDLFREMRRALLRGHTTPILRYAADCLAHLLSFMVYRRSLSLPRRASDLHLERIFEHMQAGLDRRLSVEDLAAEAGMSPSHFTRRFRSKTGFSPMEYLIRLRVQKACEYLDTTNRSIGEIAGQVGYDDPYYFSRVFRKTTGLAPREYRKEPKG
ncbi:helix-turn-helix transcriptional regulator, partial [bacterium]|nr:helix-turn-helix transcriptional regulator [bacterium]